MKAVLKYFLYTSFIFICCIAFQKAYAYDAQIIKDTTAGRQNSAHIYRVQNTGDCDCNLQVTFSVLENTGDIVVDHTPINITIPFKKGEWKEVGIFNIHADQCKKGRFATQMIATCSNKCGFDTTSKTALTEFISTCEQEYSWCISPNQCTRGTKEDCDKSGKPCYLENGICMNNIAKDCPPEEKKTFFYCTQNDQCTSAQYTTQEECQNITKKPCYENNESLCKTKASIDCPPGKKTFFYCTSSNQCTSREYVTQQECHNATGKLCYENNRQSCLNTAPTDCPPQVTQRFYWCLPNSGATSCNFNGNYANEQECENRTGADCFLNLTQCNSGATARCAVVPTERCHDSNSDGYADSCQIGGNMTQACTQSNWRQVCPQPPSLQCNSVCTSDSQCPSGFSCEDVAGGQKRCRDSRCPQRTNCTCTYCGDSLVQRPHDLTTPAQFQLPVNEECDDGNNVDDGNGCSVNCQLISGLQCNSVCTTEGALCGNTGYTCMNIGGSLLCRNGPNDTSSGNCPDETDCSCGGGPAYFTCNMICTNAGSLCDDGSSCTNINGVLRCRNGANDNMNGNCPDTENCQCGGGSSGSGPRCNNICTTLNSRCEDGTTCLNINNSLICRNSSCQSETDCTCPGGGSSGGSTSGGSSTSSSGGIKGCIKCSCVEKTVDPPIAGDNQTVRYTIVIANNTNTSGYPFTPYDIRVFDSIFQKKKFVNNDPLKGVGNYLSTEGYIEYPDQICITENTSNVEIRPNRGTGSPITSGCFSFRPGSNIGDVITFLSGMSNNPPYTSAPYFTIRNLQAGKHVTFQYSGTARTSYPGHELSKTTQFIDITNEVRTQTNNDYANVTVSKPYIITSNAGNVFIGKDTMESVNVQNLTPLFGLDPDFYKNIAGLILSPAKMISSITSYVGVLTDYFGFNAQNMASNLGKATDSIIRNAAPSAISTIASEDQLSFLGQRPDQARIFVSDGALTINLSGQIQQAETIVVKEGDLTIESNITYAEAGKTPNSIPSIAFVVLNGNIYIGKNVTHLDGVYVVKNTQKKITGDASPFQLVVNGSLFGNIDELLTKRTFVGLPDKNGGSVVVNYDARILSATPPGLKDVLGNIIFQQIAK